VASTNTTTRPPLPELQERYWCICTRDPLGKWVSVVTARRHRKRDTERTSGSQLVEQSATHVSRTMEDSQMGGLDTDEIFDFDDDLDFDIPEIHRSLNLGRESGLKTRKDAY
jgi:hypothetical protein